MRDDDPNIDEPDFYIFDEEELADFMMKKNLVHAPTNKKDSFVGYLQNKEDAEFEKHRKSIMDNDQNVESVDIRVLEDHEYEPSMNKNKKVIKYTMHAKRPRNTSWSVCIEKGGNEKV